MKFKHIILLLLLHGSLAIGENDPLTGASGIQFNSMNAVHAFNRIQHSVDVCSVKLCTRLSLPSAAGRNGRQIA